ncbi:MAG: DUF2029 domain-containing protein [Acidobacteria bacterium]|nr:DUF2029 domain-containing protein [Acidobacteriota bacterium]
MNRETDQESLRRTLWRMVAIIAILGAVSYGALAYFVAGEIADPESTVRVGDDYSTFHAAAQILLFGEADTLYDVDEVAAVRTALRGEVTSAAPAYVNPPAFAMLLVPLASLRYGAGLAVWTVAGFLALGVSLRLLHTPRPWLVLAVAATSINGFIGVRLGQAQMFWAALYGAILWRLRGSAQVQAGLFAALLSLKPQLLAPLVLWWMIDWRQYWRALLSVGAGSAVLALLPMVLFPGSYDGYFALLRESSASALQEGIPWGATLPYALFAITGPSTFVATVGFVLSNLLLVGLVVVAVRGRWHQDVMFVVAILGAAALSNHLLLYDWMVLVPAGVVVARYLPRKGVDLPAMIVSIVYASFVQMAFGASVYRRLGFTVQITSFVLIFVGIVAVRRMRSTDGAALVTESGLETTI